MIICPKCRTEQSKRDALLGQLGYIIHYRCRHCGGGWHVNVFPVFRHPVRRTERKPS